MQVYLSEWQKSFKTERGEEGKREEKAKSMPASRDVPAEIT